MGILIAGQHSKVKITLRAQDPKAPIPQHKFQIEARPLTQDELNEMTSTTAADSLWGNLSPYEITKIRLSCSFTDQVPPNINISYPAPHDHDTRSEVSAIASSTYPDPQYPSRSSAVSSPKGEQELMKEVQNLKQQLIDKDKEWAESKTRNEKLKNDLEDKENEAKKWKKKYEDLVVKTRGIGIVKVLVYAAFVCVLCWCFQKFGTPTLTDCPKLNAPTAAAARPVPPPAAASKPSKPAADDTETSPGLERP